MRTDRIVFDVRGTSTVASWQHRLLVGLWSERIACAELPLFEGLGLDAARHSGASLCVEGRPLDATPEVLLPISLSAIRNLSC